MTNLPKTSTILVKTLKGNLIILFALSVAFASCLSAKNVDKRVAKQYGEITPPRKKQPNPNIIITSAMLTADTKISNSVAKTKNVIPLIIYTEWRYINTCTLNPQIPINNFIATVQKTANKGLKEKIADYNLELNVEKIPNIFTIDDKAHVIFFGYGFAWEDVFISSSNIDLVVSYKLTKEGTESKSGLITIPYIYDKGKMGMFKSWRKATSEFLDQYDLNITEMSKSFVQQLLTEI